MVTEPKVPFFIIHTDDAGVMVEIDDAATTALSQSRAALLGKPLLNFVPRGDVHLVRGVLRRRHGVRLNLRFRPRHHEPIFVGDVVVVGDERGLVRWTVSVLPAVPEGPK